MVMLSFLNNYCKKFTNTTKLELLRSHNKYFFRVGIKTLPDPKDSDFVLTTEMIADLSAESAGVSVIQLYFSVV